MIHLTHCQGCGKSLTCCCDTPKLPHYCFDCPIPASTSYWKETEQIGEEKKSHESNSKD